MEIGIIEMIGGAATSVLIAATSWWFTRRQSRVEIEKMVQEVETMKAMRGSDVKTAEMEIVKSYNEIQKQMLEDLGKQLSALKEENVIIRQEVNERRKHNDAMKREMVTLHRDIAELRIELEKMRNEYPCADCPRRKTTSKN